jgi:hypothetical protein
MTRHLIAAILAVSLAILLLPGAVFAGEPKQVPPAPIPAQILNAKRVFIANAGGDIPWNDAPLFSGGAERAYDQFYAAMKTLGRYDLVSAPADADLLFEIQFVAVPLAGFAASRPDSIAGSPYDPQFRLVIRDPKTNALLWAVTEHAPWAVLQGNRDKNYDQALSRILADIQKLNLPLAPAAGDANRP